MVTYDGLIQFTLLLVTIVALVYEITKKITAPAKDRLF